MRVAYQYSLDARLICREIVGSLKRWEKIVVVVLVCRRMCDDDIDVGSDFEYRVETICGPSVSCDVFRDTG